MPLDLSRLVIRKKYLVPSKFSELGAAILRELLAGLPELPAGLRGWNASAERKNCWNFSLNLMFQYVMVKRGTIAGDELAELVKLINEYKKDRMGTYLEALTTLRGGAPFELAVYPVSAAESESTVDVEVKPALYYQIVQSGKVATEVELQDSYINGESFLRRVFEGGLSGTLISEEKMPISEATIELLINDAHIRQITERLHKMVDEATGEVLVSAWMGTEFINKFDQLQKNGVHVRIMTGNTKEIRNDPMQKEKTMAFKELVQILGKPNISEKLDFHGRFIIVDNKVVVGSMDMDSYSLNGTRTEYAIYTEDPEVVRGLRNYFNKIFVPMKSDSESQKMLD